MDEEWVFLAIADGAGSARSAGEGSRRAVAAALDAASKTAAASPMPADEAALLAVLEAALLAARQSLERAVTRSEPLREFATTLLLAVIDLESVAVLHIGDGWALIEEEDSRFSVLSPPQRSEYFNETVFLSGDSFRRSARISVRPLAGAKAIILMSDGLEMLLIDLAEQQPHQPAFRGLLSFFRDPSRCLEEKYSELSRFLLSERVCARTSDDKSLVVAVLEDLPPASLSAQADARS